MANSNLVIPEDLIMDTEEQVYKSRYHKIKKIGEGTYAIVYLAKDTYTGNLVAMKKIKVVSGTSGLDLSAIREIKYLKVLQYPYIINLLDVFILKQNIHLILEYSNWDLEMVVKDKRIVFMPAHIKSWMLMLLKAVDFCHQHWILHRDIKPNNLLISKDGILKLADFGLARDYGNPLLPMTSNVVTRWYQAPELLFGSKYYTHAIDMWAVGCVFAELMLRTPYLPGDSDVGQLNTIFRALGTPSEHEWPGMTSLPDYVHLQWYPKQPLKPLFTAASEDALDLLQKLLVFDPSKRLSARDALHHPYFQTLPRPTPPEDLPKPMIGQDTEEEKNKIWVDESVKNLKPRKLF